MKKMALIGNVLLLLCLSATLNQVQPSVLSRENIVSQTPRLAFEDIVAGIRKTNIRVEAINFVFKNADATASGLADLLSERNNPQVSDVLDIFNANFGVKLLVVNGENVQLDPGAYQRFLSNQAKSIVKSFFPNDLSRQMMLYGVLQQQIQRTCKAIQPAIESGKVPLEKMTALIVKPAGTVALRATWYSELLTDLETSVCNTLVNFAYSQLNSTLTSITAYLDTVTVGSGSNIVVALVSFVVDFVEEIIDGFNELAASLASSICGDLIGSSRKRRDVSDTALMDVGASDVLSRSIFSSITSVVWSLIAGILNTTLKNVWDSLITTIESYFDSFLEGTITDYVYALINSVFS